MSITYPLQVPDHNFRLARVGVEHVVGVTESPFTRQRQVVEHMGAQWHAEIELPPIKDLARARAWIAFLTALKGRRGTFEMGFPLYRGPLGDPRGSAPATTSTQPIGTETLVTSGWPLNATGVLLAGDLIELATSAPAIRHLHRVLADVAADVTGFADIEIWPPLRYDSLGGEAVNYSIPRGTWALGANLTQWDETHLQLYGIRFTAVEAGLQPVT